MEWNSDYVRKAHLAAFDGNTTYEAIAGALRVPFGVLVKWMADHGGNILRASVCCTPLWRGFDGGRRIRPLHRPQHLPHRSRCSMTDWLIFTAAQVNNAKVFNDSERRLEPRLIDNPTHPNVGKFTLP